MDKVERYRKIIEVYLTTLTDCQYANADAQNEVVLDRDNNRYLVVTTGWEGKDKRIYFNLLHLDIINVKVWIQRDGTEEGVGYALEATDVPKYDIVLAFHSENVRIHTGYAVA